MFIFVKTSLSGDFKVHVPLTLMILQQVMCLKDQGSSHTHMVTLSNSSFLPVTSQDSPSSLELSASSSCSVIIIVITVAVIVIVDLLFVTPVRVRLLALLLRGCLVRKIADRLGWAGHRFLLLFSAPVLPKRAPCTGLLQPCHLNDYIWSCFPLLQCKIHFRVIHLRWKKCTVNICNSMMTSIRH